MGQAYFYHLTRRPLEATLTILLERSLQAGWQVAVRGQDRARMDWLDQKLWLEPEDGFLPHGLAGGPQDAAQPILLTWQADPVAERQCLMCIDGADLSPGDVNSAERVCVLFNGHDPDAVQHARTQWKALKDAGCSAKYWSEYSGRWEMKAET